MIFHLVNLAFPRMAHVRLLKLLQQKHRYQTNKELEIQRGDV
ncbi:hypothetical protein VCR3J2_310131 [Vibrio coralliirubri]|nr:hypothetical protein VCR15J2_60056 [Vibrio coralliirubri]CDT81198.1 hypothetical protein VCR12J2_1030149 [Vibrio coralliirubri]CDT86155.1 hypothetical protein VCR3J2_310131 [Vibrio coralliirubri]CDU12678.1 hypothetical protein VCR17J2_380048 [Vibrio coralliirubri]